MSYGSSNDYFIKPTCSTENDRIYEWTPYSCSTEFILTYENKKIKIKYGKEPLSESRLSTVFCFRLKIEQVLQGMGGKVEVFQECWEFNLWYVGCIHNTICKAQKVANFPLLFGPRYCSSFLGWENY